MPTYSSSTTASASACIWASRGTKAVGRRPELDLLAEGVATEPSEPVELRRGDSHKNQEQNWSHLKTRGKMI